MTGTGMTYRTSGAAWPPATKRAKVQRLLAVDQVVTLAQLQRWGVSEVVRWQALPVVTRTCRTRVNQSDSDVDLAFVAWDAAVLDQAPRDLMHLAALAETRSRKRLQPGEEWRHVSVAGRSRGHLPDVEILQMLDPTRRSDWAVEFDAGYPWSRVRAKLTAAAADGYTRLCWATSVHGRVQRVMDLATRLQQEGHLPGVVMVETCWVDFWSEENRYVSRPRCHKPMALAHRFSAGAGRAA